MLRASASSLVYRAVYGAPGDQEHAILTPSCSLLTIDGVTIMLDCGWSSAGGAFDTTTLDKLLAVLPTVDAIILSSPEFEFCGAIPFVMQHLAPHTTVFAPSSTSRMGLFTALSTCLSHFPNTATFTTSNGVSTTINVDSIYSAFRRIREPAGGKAVVTGHSAATEHVSITLKPVFAGRCFGGFAWHISFQTDEIFYSPSFSFGKSSLIRRMKIPSGCNLLLTGAFPAAGSTLGGPVRVPAKAASSTGGSSTNTFQSTIVEILNALRRDRDVLIPIVAAARGVELLSLLEGALKERGASHYRIVFVAMQSREIIHRARTMTEVLSDEANLSEDDMLSTIVPCSRLEEVLAVPSPKIVVADGLTLDADLAAELFQHYATPAINSNAAAEQDSAKHLVVLDPTASKLANSNASLLASLCDGSGTAKGVKSFNYTRRVRLTEEELEAYYLDLERRQNLEREALSRELAEPGVASYAAVVKDDADYVTSDDDDWGAGGAATIAQPVQEASAITGGKRKGDGHDEDLLSKQGQGLFLPRGVVNAQAAVTGQKSLVFPAMELTQVLKNTPDMAYGIPMLDWELKLFRARAPDRPVHDEGPEMLELVNAAQVQANVPSKIVQERFSVSFLAVNVLVADLSGQPTAAVVEQMIKTQFAQARYVLPVRGNHEDAAHLINFCRSERLLKCGEKMGTAYVPTSNIPIELATVVYSFQVKMDPLFAQSVQDVRRVQVARTGENWEIGWADSMISRSVQGVTSDADAADAGGGERPNKRQRKEQQDAATAETTPPPEDLPTLVPVPPARFAALAAFKDQRGFAAGSVFVGDVQLPALRESLRNELTLRAEVQSSKDAQLLLLPGGQAAVRKMVRNGATELTVECMASSYAFTVRELVHKQFHTV